MLPRTVIYDARLTLPLPAGLTATSGLNAIAHAAEGLYAQDANPVMPMFAEEGMRSASARRFPYKLRARSDLDARRWRSWRHGCGTVLGNVGMALHHKPCHTLGGSFNLPHAETHAGHPALCNGLQSSGGKPEAASRLSRGARHDARLVASIDPRAAAYDAPESLAALGLRAAIWISAAQ